MGNCWGKKKKKITDLNKAQKENAKISQRGNLNDFGSNFTHFKLIIMGPKRSGKTTFFKTFLNDPTNPFTEKDLDTQYDDVIKDNFFSYTFKIDTDLYKCNLWDLAGDLEDEIINITGNFIHFSRGVFLMFDLTNPESFRAVRENWVPMIKDSSIDFETFQSRRLYEIMVSFWGIGSFFLWKKEILKFVWSKVRWINILEYGHLLCIIES